MQKHLDSWSINIKNLVKLRRPADFLALDDRFGVVDPLIIYTLSMVIPLCPIEASSQNPRAYLAA